MKLQIKRVVQAIIFIPLILLLSNVPNAYALDHIKIISVKPSKYYGNNNDALLNKECKKWHLNKKQISEIFHLSEKTTYMEIDLGDTSILSCEVRGTLMIKGEVSDFHIDAGSSSVIFNKNDTTYYVCKKKQCEKYFF